MNKLFNMLANVTKKVREHFTPAQAEVLEEMSTAVTELSNHVLQLEQMPVTLKKKFTADMVLDIVTCPMDKSEAELVARGILAAPTLMSFYNFLQRELGTAAARELYWRVKPSFNQLQGAVITTVNFNLGCDAVTAEPKVEPEKKSGNRRSRRKVVKAKPETKKPVVEKTEDLPPWEEPAAEKSEPTEWTEYDEYCEPYTMVSDDHKLDWKFGKGMFKAMLAQGKHPLVVELFRGMSFDESHRATDDRKVNGKHEGWSQTGADICGVHIPGYWDVRAMLGDSEEAKRAASAVNSVWQDMADVMHYGLRNMYESCMYRVLANIGNAGVDFGPFVDNTPEFEEWAYATDIAAAIPTTTEEPEYDETQCPWNQPKVETEEPEDESEHGSLVDEDDDEDESTHGSLVGDDEDDDEDEHGSLVGDDDDEDDDEDEGPAATVVNADGTPVVDDPAAHDFDGWDEEPEVKKPVNKVEEEEYTDEDEAYDNADPAAYRRWAIEHEGYDPDAVPEEEDVSHIGHSIPEQQAPTIVDGKLIAPMAQVFAPLKEVITKVKTDWCDVVNVREDNGKWKPWASNWAGAKFCVQVCGEPLECRSIQHAAYVLEMAYWGFVSEAQVACDIKQLPQNDRGYSVITDGSYWKKRLDTFHDAHPETRVNSIERMAHLEFEAWRSLYRDSRNQKQIQALKATGRKHIVATKKGDGYQVTNLTRILEVCRDMVVKAGF